MKIWYVIRDYYWNKHYYMIWHIVKLHIQLKLRIKCDCPFVSGKHRVEVIYWARTAYHWNKGKEDPNGPVVCCRQCAKKGIAYWDEMWSEYYSSII